MLVDRIDDSCDRIWSLASPFETLIEYNNPTYEMNNGINKTVCDCVIGTIVVRFRPTMRQSE